MSYTGYFRCVVRPPQRPGCISPSPTAALRILISYPLRIRIQHPAAPRERVGPSPLRIGRLLRCADSLSSTLRPTEDAVRCSICQQRLHLPTGPHSGAISLRPSPQAGPSIAVEAPPAHYPACPGKGGNPQPGPRAHPSTRPGEGSDSPPLTPGRTCAYHLNKKVIWNRAARFRNQHSNNLDRAA